MGKWLLVLSSVGNLGLAPLIMMMGYNASSFDYNGLLVVDKALVVLGVFVFLTSAAAIFASCKDQSETLLFVFYTAIIEFILLSVFGLGAINFNETLEEYIDKHWEELRATTGKYSMTEFKQHVQSELLALGAFSFTINVSIFIQAMSILHQQGLRRVMIALFPLTQLLFIVFASAIMIIAIYIQANNYYSSAMPIYSSYVLFAIAFFIVVLAILGYKAGITANFQQLVIYNVLLLFCGIVCLFSGIGLLTMTSTLKELVYKEWPLISRKLL